MKRSVWEIVHASNEVVGVVTIELFDEHAAELSPEDQVSLQRFVSDFSAHPSKTLAVRRIDALDE